MFGPINRTLRNKTTQDTNKKILYGSGCFYVHRQFNLAFYSVEKSRISTYEMIPKWLFTLYETEPSIRLPETGHSFEYGGKMWHTDRRRRMSDASDSLGGLFDGGRP